MHDRVRTIRASRGATVNAPVTVAAGRGSRPGEDAGGPGMGRDPRRPVLSVNTRAEQLEFMERWSKKRVV